MKKQSKKPFWDRFKPVLISYLKQNFVKAALKKLLGSAIAGGFKAWIIKYIVTELFEEVAQPLIELAFRKAGYMHEVKQGEHTLKRIQNAQNNDDWRDAINDA